MPTPCKACCGTGTVWVVDRVVQGQDYGPHEEGHRIKCSKCNGGKPKVPRKIYEAIAANDTGYSGCNSALGFFLHKKDAEAAIKGKGSWGYGDGTVEEHILYESFEDYNNTNPESVRKKALAKLTPEEKEALGL